MGSDAMIHTPSSVKLVQKLLGWGTHRDTVSQTARTSHKLNFFNITTWKRVLTEMPIVTTLAFIRSTIQSCPEPVKFTGHILVLLLLLSFHLCLDLSSYPPFSFLNVITLHFHTYSISCTSHPDNKDWTILALSFIMDLGKEMFPVYELFCKSQIS
jgi:hypothetical protein